MPAAMSACVNVPPALKGVLFSFRVPEAGSVLAVWAIASPSASSTKSRLGVIAAVAPSLTSKLLLLARVGGVLLLFVTVRLKVLLTSFAGASEATALMLMVPTSQLLGVPEKVAVLGSKLSQFGRGLPLAKMAR